MLEPALGFARSSCCTHCGSRIPLELQESNPFHVQTAFCTEKHFTKENCTCATHSDSLSTAERTCDQADSSSSVGFSIRPQTLRGMRSGNKHKNKHEPWNWCNPSETITIAPHACALRVHHDLHASHVHLRQGVHVGLGVAAHLRHHGFLLVPDAAVVVATVEQVSFCGPLKPSGRVSGHGLT